MTEVVYKDIEVELIDHMGDDLRVSNVARVSFNKWKEEIDDKDAKLIDFLAREEHTSPFRHTAIQLRCKAPISLARQLGKHQAGFSWNECYSEDTEVLTESGWKLWKDVSKNDKLATPRTCGGGYTFEFPKELIVNDFEGEMIHIYSRDLDMMVTPNHDQYVSWYRGGDDPWTSYQKMPTMEAVRKKFAKTLPMPELDLPEGDDYYEGVLYGAFLGDGSLSEDTQRIYFHVKKEKKKDFLRDLASKTPEFGWSETEKSDGYSYFRIRNIKNWEGKVDTKEIDFYKNTKTFFRGVLDGLVRTDGSISKGGNITYSTVSLPLKKSLERLAYTLGFDIKHHYRNPVGNWRGVYKMSIKKVAPKLLKNWKKVPYSGKVYCARTETGLLIVRRNGKSCVSGNCSRRYVDDGFEFYRPRMRARAPTKKQGSEPFVVNNEELCNTILIQNTKFCFERFNTLLENGVAPEVARNVLPQNMMVDWIWTGNLLGIYHLYRLRVGEGAQEEAKEFAEKVGVLVEPIFPLCWKALKEN